MRDLVRRSRVPAPKTTKKLMAELLDLVKAYEGAKGRPVTRASLADTLIHWMPRILEEIEKANRRSNKMVE